MWEEERSGKVMGQGGGKIKTETGQKRLEKGGRRAREGGKVRDEKGRPILGGRE